MAKIYLLSGGDYFPEEVVKSLKKDLKGKHNLVSIGAKREYEKNDIYFYGSDSSIGTIDVFNFSDLDNFNLIDGRTKKEEGLELLKNADIIYLQGGDPFVQLDFIMNNGYDKFLKKYDGIILGLSAGTMNLGKIAFYSKDDDYPESKFYEALGLTDLIVDPHFDINNDEKVKEITKFSRKHTIIGLPDYSAIIIDNEGVIESIGPNYIYENEKRR